jgi:hypothetical protein
LLTNECYAEVRNLVPGDFSYSLYLTFSCSWNDIDVYKHAIRLWYTDSSLRSDALLHDYIMII